MFEKEMAFFKANQADLVREHNGRVLIIRGDELQGVYDSPLDAYLYAQEHFDPGTFMIQECGPGPDAYTVTINSLATVEG